jgi:hypothetical protein
MENTKMANKRSPETTVIRPLKVDYSTVNTNNIDWGRTTTRPQGSAPHSPMGTKPNPGFPSDARPQGEEEK